MSLKSRAVHPRWRIHASPGRADRTARCLVRLWIRIRCQLTRKSWAGSSLSGTGVPLRSSAVSSASPASSASASVFPLRRSTARRQTRRSALRSGCPDQARLAAVSFEMHQWFARCFARPAGVRRTLISPVPMSVPCIRCRTSSESTSVFDDGRADIIEPWSPNPHKASLLARHTPSSSTWPDSAILSLSTRGSVRLLPVPGHQDRDLWPGKWLVSPGSARVLEDHPRAAQFCTFVVGPDLLHRRRR